MIPTAHIEDALIADIQRYVNGVKTVRTWDRDLDEQQLSQVILLAPFILVRFGGTRPVESERHADGSSGLKANEYWLLVGAQSLRGKQVSQRGCYELLDDLRARYDSGATLTVDGEKVSFSLAGIEPKYAGNLLVMYGMALTTHDA